MSLPTGFFKSGGRILNEDGVEFAMADSTPVSYTAHTQDANGNPLTFEQNGHEYTATYDANSNMLTLVRTS